MAHTSSVRRQKLTLLDRFLQVLRQRQLPLASMDTEHSRQLSTARMRSSIVDVFWWHKAKFAPLLMCS